MCYLLRISDITTPLLDFQCYLPPCKQKMFNMVRYDIKGCLPSCIQPVYSIQAVYTVYTVYIYFWCYCVLREIFENSLLKVYFGQTWFPRLIVDLYTVYTGCIQHIQAVYINIWCYCVLWKVLKTENVYYGQIWFPSLFACHVYYTITCNICVLHIHTSFILLMSKGQVVTTVPMNREN